MSDLAEFDYLLPISLRAKLSSPLGDLVEGSIDETVPVLKERLVPHEFLLVAVGDVTANLFVEYGFYPDIIVTDGQTKRKELETWIDWEGFEVLEASCPAAEIRSEAWKVLRRAVFISQETPVHVKIYGEEDLLVLPLLIELPLGSVIVYGQPNRGAVIRNVSETSKEYAIEIIKEMEIK